MKKTDKLLKTLTEDQLDDWTYQVKNNRTLQIYKNDNIGIIYELRFNGNVWVLYIKKCNLTNQANANIQEYLTKDVGLAIDIIDELQENGLGMEKR